MTFPFEKDEPPRKFPDIGSIQELRHKIESLENQNNLLMRAISENYPVEFKTVVGKDDKTLRKISHHINDEDFYVVYVKLKEYKNFRGVIETKEDEWAYLGMTGYNSREMNYPALKKVNKPNLDFPQGEKFKTEPTRKDIEVWDKWPYDCNIKEAHIFHIQKTTKTIIDTTQTVTSKVLT